MQAGTYGITLPIHTDLDLSQTQTLHLAIWQPGSDPDTDEPDVVRDLPSGAIATPPSSRIINLAIQQGDFPYRGLYVIQVTDTTTGREIPLDDSELYLEGFASTAR